MITGERICTAPGGFNPSFQRHPPEYRLCASLVGSGHVVDLGCGTGHSYAELPHGPAIFVTPNRLTSGVPTRSSNPYHFVESDAGDVLRRDGAVGPAGSRLRSPGGEPSATVAVQAARYPGTVPVRADDRAVKEAGTGVRCAWCGAPATPSAARLAMCSACGTATTYPRPDEQELEQAYATWYRPASGRFSAGGDRLLALSRASLARRLDRIAPPGPLLDVGSGDGTLLAAVRARGREVVGLEREAGADGVIAAEIDEFADRAGEWAGVVFWHSLEHLRDPAAAIDRAVALLARDGVLVVAVPNLGSWQARCFGERWFHLDLPRHLVHLPSAALVQGLQARGLRIERCCHWRGGQLVFGWLYGIIGALPGQPDLYSAIRRPEAQGSAITGARRAAALLAATALAPVATALTVGEVRAQAGGTVYIEARR